MNHILSLPAEKLARLIQSKEISPVELTKTVLNHAENNQKQLNAYIHFMRDCAEKAAKKAEKEILQGNYRGMYHGIPIAIKDNIYVKNEWTTMASKIHRDFKSSYDATVVERLKDAGAILIGKLNMHEYAWGITTNNPHYGACRNPWDIEKIPGGSSGGSGAAVAADMCVASLGTDTAGSIRIPAAACGIIGLKPTYGRVSNYGSYPLSYTLDHIGPMTKTVKDAAGLLEVIAGFDAKDRSSANQPVEKYTEQVSGNVKDLVIGVNEAYFFNHVDRGIEKLVRKGIETLVDMGAKVEKIEIPSIDKTEWIGMITTTSESATIHDKNLTERLKDYGKDIQSSFESFMAPSAVKYLQAQQMRETLREDFRKVFTKADVIISPTLPVMPPKVGKVFADLNGEKVDLATQFMRFNFPGNLTGLPAISVPCGLKDDMPVGMQIIGPPFAEGTILNVAFALEQTDPLNSKKPKYVTYNNTADCL